MQNSWKEELLKFGNRISSSNELRNNSRHRRGFLLILCLLCVLLHNGAAQAEKIICPAAADVSIDEWYPDENFNYKTRVVVATNKNIHHGIARGLYYFDIPADLAAARIKSAAIYLSSCTSCGGGNGGVVGFYALNKPFDEAADTWSSLEGGDWDGSVYTQATLPKGNDWNQGVDGQIPPDGKGFDITALLRNNLDKVRTNGIMMRFVDEHQEPFTHQNVASRETKDPLDFPPQIIIQTEEPLCPAEVMLGEDRQALSLLRKFRDQVLAKTPAGRKCIEFYYRHAAEITTLLAADEDLRRQTSAALPGLLAAVRCRLEKRPAGNLRDMDTALQNLINFFMAKAGPLLQKDIAAINAFLLSAKSSR
jgi:hypothetical protein